MMKNATHEWINWEQAMRSVIKKIFQILDGTPAVYGRPTRGQSVVELTLVSPILIVLLMGLAEIGWFANNYLILLETTRVGARFGTVQSGDSSPLRWNNIASVSPNVVAPPPTDTTYPNYRNCSSVNTIAKYAGFYNILACVMLQSMSPLVFHSAVYTGDPNYVPYPPTPSNPTPAQVDDIVISVFSLEMIDPNDPNIPATLKPKIVSESSVPPGSPEVLVVGRYPTNANECNVTGFNERDPFDYIQDNGRDFSYENGLDPAKENNRFYMELGGYDSATEIQRGFDWAGTHKVTGSSGSTVCYGSEWSLARVQQLVNLPNFQLLNSAQRGRLASQGMVLVEMFWRHGLLLKNPVFDPVFSILGENTVISVWSAFPVPAVEPRLKFPQPTPAYTLGVS